MRLRRIAVLRIEPRMMSEQFNKQAEEASEFESPPGIKNDRLSFFSQPFSEIKNKFYSLSLPSFLSFSNFSLFISFFSSLPFFLLTFIS